MILFVISISCKDSVSTNELGDNGTNVENPFPDADTLDPGIADDYSGISHISNFEKWGSHNVHDPTLIKAGDTYYMYSTDVYYGGAGVPADDPRLDPKIPIRKSTDLVHWTPIGHVFEEMPEEIVTWMRDIQPSFRPESVWAPFIMRLDEVFRLYYSVPANDGLQAAYIGFAESSSPEGPWEHQGLVLPTFANSSYNGIDPAVMIDKAFGHHWLYFGSWGDGIRTVELNPDTGFRKDSLDKGTVVASRFIDWTGSPPMEGAEVLYNPDQEKYYMFLSYEPLIERYNVRVGRADTPEGPYYDYFGNAMLHSTDNFPRLTAQYRFNNHRGWQGVGHSGLIRDGDDYYFASQGRLGSNEPFIHLMNLHLRKMVWTEDGWPVLSPQRYAAIPQDREFTIDHIVGWWEHITLEQIGEKNESVMLSFSQDQTINETGSWSLNDRIISITLPGGREFKAHLMWGWDWENSVRTILFTGLNSSGVTEWGKRVES